MEKFKFFLKENINETYPEGILNGYYNYNMPYDELRPYYKSCCGVDIYSEVEATTHNDLMILDKWVNVWITSVLIDGVVYRSEHVGDQWNFPENWVEDKRYIYEFMIITYPMLDETDISEDSWEEVMVDNNYIENYVPPIDLPQREENDAPQPPDERGVYIRTSDRLVMLEDAISYNV
jgi:hypothetical protein